MGPRASLALLETQKYLEMVGLQSPIRPASSLVSMLNALSRLTLYINILI